MSSKGYIYVLSLAPMGLKGFKIGKTKNLKRRMKQLDVPNRATLYKWFYVQDMHTCEKVMHKLFASKRVPQSEWFDLTDDQLKQLVKRLRKWKDDEKLETKVVTAQWPPAIPDSSYPSSSFKPASQRCKPASQQWEPIKRKEKDLGLNDIVAAFFTAIMIFFFGGILVGGAARTIQDSTPYNNQPVIENRSR